MQLMQSDEGKNMMGSMMSEMKDVLTDPEKMKEGLKQFSSNPMLCAAPIWWPPSCGGHPNRMSTTLTPRPPDRVLG